MASFYYPNNLIALPPNEVKVVFKVLDRVAGVNDVGHAVDKYL